MAQLPPWKKNGQSATYGYAQQGTSAPAGLPPWKKYDSGNTANDYTAPATTHTNSYAYAPATTTTQTVSASPTASTKTTSILPTVAKQNPSSNIAKKGTLEKYLSDPQWSAIANKIAGKSATELTTLKQTPTYNSLPQEMKTYIDDTIIASQKKQAKESPTAAKVMSFSSGALDSATFGLSKAMDDGNTAQKNFAEELKQGYPKSYMFGEIVGTLPGGGVTDLGARAVVKAGIKTLGKQAGKEVAEKAATSAAKQIIKRAGTEAAIAGISNAAYGVAYDASLGKDKKEIAKEALINLGIGGALGGLGGGLTAKSTLKKSSLLPEVKATEKAAKTSDLPAKQPEAKAKSMNLTSETINGLKAQNNLPLSPHEPSVSTQFKTGDNLIGSKVVAKDRNNIGTVMNYDKLNDRYMLRFVSKSGATAVKWFSPEQLEGVTKSLDASKGLKITTPTTTTDKVYSQKYQEYIDQYGAIGRGEIPSREIGVPLETPAGKTRQFYRTAMESPGADKNMLKDYKDTIESSNAAYDIITDQKALSYAKATIANKGFGVARADWEAVVNGSNSADKNSIALGTTLLREAMQMGDRASVGKITAGLARQLTKAGQTVQAARLLKRATPEGKLYYIQQYVNRINEVQVSKYGENAKLITLSDDLMDKFINVKSIDELDQLEYQIMQEVYNQVPASTLDKIDAWRYLAMLGNPKTHIRNLVGNSAMWMVRKAKNATGTGLEHLFLRKGQERTKAIMLPTKDDKVLKTFASHDYDGMKGIMASGGKFDVDTLVEKNRRIFDTKWLERLRQKNFNALEFFDNVFMGSAYKDSMAQYMKANKLSAEFLSSGSVQAIETLEKARKYAISEALRSTFREANSAAMALNKLERKNIGTRLAVGGLAPFKKTPLNIAKRGVEYSPLRLVDSLTRQAYKLKQGEITSAEFIEKMSQGLTGTGIMAIGAWLASMGLITTRDDSKGKEAKYNDTLGEQDYAINIGDKSYTIDWVVPASLPFLVGAEAYKVLSGESGGKEGLGRALDVITKIDDPMFNLTMLQSLNNAFKYEDSLSGAAISSLSSYATQAVPTVFGQIARTIDKTARNTYAPADSQYGQGGEEALRRVGAKIPGVSTLLEPKVDLWGNDVKYADTTGGAAVSNFLSPGYFKDKKVTAVDQEIMKIYKANGDTDVIPKEAPKSIIYQGNTYYLTAKERTEYQRILGKTSYEALNEKIGNSSNIKSSYTLEEADKRTKVFRKVYQKATDKAKQNFFTNRGIRYE